MILTLSSLYVRYLVHIYCIDFGNVWMFAGIFSCTPSFSPEINKVYLILSYLITLCMLNRPHVSLSIHSRAHWRSRSVVMIPFTFTNLHNGGHELLSWFHSPSLIFPQVEWLSSGSACLVLTNCYNTLKTVRSRAYLFCMFTVQSECAPRLA